MTVAILNRPSASLGQCELTFLERSPIDVTRAARQHDEYADALSSLGARIVILDVNSTCADGVFVEDLAVVLDEIAVIASMGVASRRAETAALAAEIARYRKLIPIRLPATLEGGDVLRMGRTLYVGETSRTNAAGIEALRSIVAPFGYSVIRVPIPDCLHLKTCVTALDDETLVVNPNWVDVQQFDRFRRIKVDPTEPFAANTLQLNGRVLLNASFPKTADKVEASGFNSLRVDISEFGKAEAGLTCLSLLFTDSKAGTARKNSE